MPHTNGRSHTGTLHRSSKRTWGASRTFLRHYHQVSCPCIEGSSVLICALDTIEYHEMRFRHTLLTGLQALATGMTLVDDSLFCTPRTHGFFPLVPGQERRWAKDRGGYRRSQLPEEVQMGSRATPSCDSYTGYPGTKPTRLYWGLSRPSGLNPYRFI